MALQVTRGGSGQLYGGALNTLQKTGTPQQTVYAPANFTNTWSPQPMQPAVAAQAPAAPAPAPVGLTSDQRAAQAAAAQQAAEQADEQAWWEDQLAKTDSSLGRLSGQRDIGYANLEDSYQSGLTSLNNSKTAAQSQYDTTRARTVQDNIQNKAQVDNGVRTQLSGIQRLLASRGAGKGSAATKVAPYAAALQGNQRRQQIQQTYGRNINDLDGGWNMKQAEFTNAYGALDTDKRTKRNELDSGFAQTEAELLSSRADAEVSKRQAAGQTYTQARAGRAPYESRISQLISQMDSLGRNATFKPQQVTYKAPELQNYSYDKFVAPTANSGVDPAAAVGTGAYWNLLQGQDPRKKQQLI